MQDATVYDPTCGSGSLLLKVTEQSTNGLSIYGQEMDNATFSLARMNMILHGRETAEIWQDNTLSSPHWKNAKGGLKQFDFAVANPPFSFKAWSTGVETDADQYGRFDYGVPPEKNGDYAFLLHILKSLTSTGKGAVILPHGVLFRGNVEADIRRNLIRQGFIKGIIGLPANLFYGTGIPACILILDKEHASARTGIFMLDGSKGFAKDGNKNRLREQDIHKIVDIFNSQTQIDGFSRMVTLAEIEKNDFNLNLPRYIDSSQKDDIHDLFAHMNGGIPARDVAALDAYWQVFPSLQQAIFRPHKNPGYSELQISGDDIRQMILANGEFIAFQQQSLARFTDWQQAHRQLMENIEIGQRPKAIIKQLSQDLLQSFADAPLLDKYDIYQIIMEYWNEHMQDDVFLLVQDGWQVGQSVRQLVPVKNKKGKAEYKEAHDCEFSSGKSKQRYKSDLIPPALVINRFFKAEKQKLEKLQSQQDSAAQQVESYVEEHSGEDGLLEEAKTEKGKISATSLKQRLGQTRDKSERAAIEHALNLLKEEAAAKAKVTQARAALDKQLFEHFPALSIDDIKLLVITDKWSAHLQAAITSEIERISQKLVKRIKQLEERYQQTLAELEDAERKLGARVAGHLKKIIEKEKGRMENE